MNKAKPFIISGELGILILGAFIWLTRIENFFMDPGTDGGIFGLAVFMLVMVPVMAVDEIGTMIFPQACGVGGCTSSWQSWIVIGVLSAFLLGVVAWALVSLAVRYLSPDWKPWIFEEGRLNKTLLWTSGVTVFSVAATLLLFP